MGFWENLWEVLTFGYYSEEAKAYRAEMKSINEDREADLRLARRAMGEKRFKVWDCKRRRNNANSRFEASQAGRETTDEGFRRLRVEEQIELLKKIERNSSR